MGTCDTSWFDSGHNLHIRLYVTYRDTTTEYCYDPGSTSWTKGEYAQP